MTRVKICGLRRSADADAANACLPDFAGFVFAERSWRCIDGQTAQRLRELLDARIRTVGVFVDQPAEMIAGLAAAGIIELIQLHGDESEAYARELKRRTGLPVIRAVPVGKELPAPPPGADYPLFDTASPQRGGTGQAFDWELLREYRGDYFLAGGLGCDNVRQAVEQLHPYAVDVSSGVETGGWKDAEKMRRFVDIIRRLNT